MKNNYMEWAVPYETIGSDIQTLIENSLRTEGSYEHDIKTRARVIYEKKIQEKAEHMNSRLWSMDRKW